MKGPIDLQGRCGECLLFGAVQGMDDGLLLVDRDGIVFHINRRAEEMLGLPASKAMGGRLRAVLKPPALLRFWAQAVREADPVSTELALPFAATVRATVSLCRSAAGDRIGRALLLRDVTREKRIQIDLPVDVARRLVEMTGMEGIPGELPSLTRRETQILRLLARGLGNIAIAAELSVTANTVASHLKHLYSKIGVRNRSQAVAFALSHGIRASKR